MWFERRRRERPGIFRRAAAGAWHVPAGFLFLARGLAVQHSRGLGWEMLQSFKGSMYFVLSAPVVLLLSLVPLVGPVVGTLWGAHALAFQQTDVPLARRGRDFSARRAWHRRYR